MGPRTGPARPVIARITYPRAKRVKRPGPVSVNGHRQTGLRILGTVTALSSDVRWLTPEQQRAWRSYLAVTILLGDQLDRDLQRDAGMPHGYYEILVHLSEEPEHALRMSVLAERTRSSRSRLSHAVARLEERGWIVREDCAEDKRGQLARLTDDGFTALQDAAPRHVESVRRYLIDRLTPEQIGQLEAIATAVLGGLPGVATCPGAD